MIPAVRSSAANPRVLSAGRRRAGDRAQQAHLRQKRGQRGEARHLDFVTVRAVARGRPGTLGVQTRPGVRNRIAEQEAEEVPTDPVDVRHEPFVDPRHGLHPLAGTVARELDVTGFFGDVNPHQSLDHRLQFRVIHHLALQRIEDLFTDQGGDPQHRAPLERQGQRVDDHAVVQPRTHRLGADALDGFAEHDHVAGLIAQLGQLVMRRVARGVLVQDGAQ